MTELCPNQGVYSTTRLALHPDGTPMISIGPAVDLSKPSPALDPEHSRQCLAVPPPADGEVAELLAWLKLQIDRHTHWAQAHDRTQLGRLIALLERQQPQPVPDKLPERLTVQEISDLPHHGENYIYSGDRSPDEIELDGAFSRADLQQLANSLSTSRSNSEMTDLPNTPLQENTMASDELLTGGTVNTTNIVSTTRMGKTVPDAYRLVTKDDSNGNTIYVLQGYFTWTQGWSQRGGKWRDLETQDGLTAQDDIPFRG